MLIELATVDDLSKLTLLFNQYQRFYKQQPSLDDSKSFLQDRFSAGDSLIYACRAGEEIAGFSQIYFSLSSVTMQRIWILNDLFVEPSFRRKGVAGLLIERIIQDAGDQGVKSVLLETAHTNHQAQALYQKMNFSQDRESVYFTYVL